MYEGCRLQILRVNDSLYPIAFPLCFVYLHHVVGNIRTRISAAHFVFSWFCTFFYRICWLHVIYCIVWTTNLDGDIHRCSVVGQAVSLSPNGASESRLPITVAGREGRSVSDGCIQAACMCAK